MRQRGCLVHGGGRDGEGEIGVLFLPERKMQLGYFSTVYGCCCGATTLCGGVVLVVVVQREEEK
ncbi:hypothetical protein SADUNF_Sadunf09G0027700 [Salix dunnii]|uniref:Uncharacterized protein n=1 Tax=Salix dunnii TaxID=1413687 RepID=A0A835JVF0_9ROSI|nr:hypothetical protein SADUNF_Sadunf09G0027700 [Salix dunnii]